MSGRYLVGLDIGTTKVCAAVARLERGGLQVVGSGLSATSGLKKGVVVDLDVTAEAIRQAVSEAEAASAVEIKSVYIGVSGGHVQCLSSYGATGIKGKAVTRKDVDRVMESAAAVYVPLDRELLHVLPVDYAIDGQQGIVRPVGMSGVRLEANVRLVTASHTAVENLVRCCQRAGLRVIEAVFEPIAFSAAVAGADELEGGVVVIDMGGGATKVAVYKDGALKHASVVPVGGAHLTNDMAIGLKLTRQEAERVKGSFGHAVGDGKGPDEVEVRTVDGQMRKVPLRFVTAILRPRCEELFALLRQDIEHTLLYEHPSCVVLTGGGALLAGVDRLAEAALGLPVRTGMPEGRASLGPQCATSVGLALFGARAERSVHETAVEGALARAREWAKTVLEVKGWGLGLKRPVRVNNPERPTSV